MRITGFLVAAIALAVCGTYSISTGLPHLAYPRGRISSLSPATLCFLVAGWFCFLIAFESSRLSFSNVMLRWHFVITAITVCLMVLGLTAFLVTATRHAESPTLDRLTAVLAVPMLLSAPTFLAAQIWFVVDLSRVAFKFRAS